MVLLAEVSQDAPARIYLLGRHNAMHNIEASETNDGLVNGRKMVSGKNEDDAFEVTKMVDPRQHRRCQQATQLVPGRCPAFADQFLDFVEENHHILQVSHEPENS